MPNSGGGNPEKSRKYRKYEWDRLLAFDLWKRNERTLVETSDDPRVQAFIEAAALGVQLRIRYFGGANPLMGRTIKPLAVFKVFGFEHNLYLQAFCHSRHEERTFRLDKVQIGVSQLFEAIGREVPESLRYARSKPAAESILSSKIEINLAEIETLDAFQNLIANQLEFPVFDAREAESFLAVSEERFDEISIIFSNASALDKDLLNIVLGYVAKLKINARQSQKRISVEFYH
ncbi:MAG: WYL domain-containing protein [Candidatus Sumerlaeota bacterium]